MNIYRSLHSLYVTTPHKVLFLLVLGLLSQPALAKKPLSVIAYQVGYIQLQEQVTVLGQLRAVDSIHLTANTSRNVSKIHFKDGQRVEKGQLLVEFNARQELAELQEKQIASQEAKKQYSRLKRLKERSANVSQAQIDEQYRDWQVLEAQANVLKAKIADLRISAPFTGQLGLKQFSTGEFITQGQTLVTLDNIQQMQMDMQIAEQYLNGLSIGQPVNLSSSAYPSTTFSANISAISPQLDTKTRMLQVRAILNNPQSLLKSNMWVTAQIDLPAKNTLMIPNKSILMLGDHNYVYKLSNSASDLASPMTVEKVSVKIGKTTRNRTEILSGLNAGDIIVSQGILRIKEGRKITVTQLENNAEQQRLLARPDQTTTNTNRSVTE